MKNLLNDTIDIIKRNQSTILTVIAVVGTVGTVVLTVDSTIKALDDIKEVEDSKCKLTSTEKLALVGRHYIPPIICASGTIACILGANMLNKHSQASLVSACGLVSNQFNDYVDKVKDIYGKDAHEKILKELGAEKVSNDMIITSEYLCQNFDQTLNDPDSEKKLFYDQFSDRYFESTIEQVLAAQYALNRNYILRGGEACINEFYHLLGIKEIMGGDELGWVMTDEGEYWVEFINNRTKIKEGIYCYEIIMPWAPSMQYMYERGCW